MRPDQHPFRHGGLWWRIAAELAAGPRRFGDLFRATRARARPRSEEKARFQHALRAMSRVGLLRKDAAGFCLTTHGVREQARLGGLEATGQALDDAA
jgi:hypothetical protein